MARLRGVGVRGAVRHQQRAADAAELHRQLAHCGITADDADLLRSADVAAGMLAPGSSAVVLGGDGVLEALAARGVLVVPEEPADAVVVGLTRDFTYEKLTLAVTAVRNGARLVGTNEDATYPTPDGLVPGAGAILAAVVTASGQSAEVAGKPHRPTADAITARVGAGELRVMVGDRPSTDGALAAQLGDSLRPGPLGRHPEGGDPTRRRPRRRRTRPAPTRRPGPPEPRIKCLPAASTSDTLVQWQAMSAYASTSMRGPSSDRSAVAGPRRSCENW